MSVRHLFMWSVNPPERGQEVLDELASLADHIPVKNWSIGKNVFAPLGDDRARHFEYALTCDFDTPEELDAYQNHPLHQEIVDRVMPLYGDWAVVDLTLP